MSRIQWFWFGLLVLGIAGALLLYQTRWRDPYEGHQCVQLYKSARTAAESSLVDSRRPPLLRGRGEYTGPIPTCGELRKLGKVR